MKHLKSYENLLYDPQVEDYVIANAEYLTNKEYVHFIKNNIGQIIKISNVSIYTEYDITNASDSVLIYGFYPINEMSENVLKNISYKTKRLGNIIYTSITSFRKDEFLYHSKNKEELEEILTQNKYNL